MSAESRGEAASRDPVLGGGCPPPPGRRLGAPASPPSRTYSGGLRGQTLAAGAGRRHLPHPASRIPHPASRIPRPASRIPVTEPYSALAPGYDAVMAHVDYPSWAAHVQSLVREHHPEAASVVELGCGTGALAVSLQPSGPPPSGYAYRAFDGSAAMIEQARETVRRAGRPVALGVLAFGDPVPGPPADVVVLVYDGLNYVLDLGPVGELLASIRDALAPGGVAIVDQSTPANSVNHADGFDDAGETDAFSYVRTSRYDADARLHTTTFGLTLPDGSEHTETHVQRAYTLDEVADAAEVAGLAVVAAYDGLGRDPADEDSERVHWVFARASDVVEAA